MDTLLHADVFFFITSVAVILITTMIIISLIYFVQILKNLRDISSAIKKGTDAVSGSVEAFINLIINNPFFKTFFGDKKPKSKRKTKKNQNEKENK